MLQSGEVKSTVSDYTVLTSKFSNTNFERLLNELGPPSDIDLSKEKEIYKRRTGKDFKDIQKFGSFLRKANYILFCDLANKWRNNNIKWDSYSELTISRLKKFWGININ